MIDNAYYYDIETKSPVRINADKASEQYSRGISSKPERNDDNRPSPYICEFCGEYLTLTKKVKKQRPHFNHYTEKDCEGKALQNNYNYKKNNPLGISLPLKIDITNNKISVSVGFRPLSNEQYDNAQKADLEVYIEEQKYNIANRISCDYTTYLPIGSNIREEYSIKFNDENCIPKEIWGRTVLGIKPSGTLFTYKNDGCEEKRLNRNATVYLNTEYLLLTKKFPTSNLIIQRKPSINDWNIYVVSAKSFTEETWLFFLSYGVNLTEKTAELIPIYPLSIRSASFVTHFSEKIWLYKTHGECEIYPNKRNFSNESRFISIPKSNLHQIVSISQKSNHTNVLKYLYIQHKENVKLNNTYEIYITDMNNVPKNKLKIQSEFDGFIREYNKSTLTAVYTIKNGETFILDVKINRKYEFYQGLDCLGEISYITAPKINVTDDNLLLQKLRACSGNEVAIQPIIKAIALKINNFPKTKLWIVSCLRRNKISEQALDILVKEFGGKMYVK